MTKPLTFRYLLGGILIAYVLAIAVPVPKIGAPLRIAVLGLLIVGVARTRRRAGRLGLPIFAGAVALFLATLGSALFGSAKTLTIVSQSATIVLTVGGMAILIHTLLGLGIVNGSTVNGVLCIYLLLALFFAAVNELCAAVVPNYLHGVPSPVRTSDMLYFSVITLTTTGFGDITPANNLARAVTSTEALLGQLYLVSVVAAVVSRYQRTSR